MSTDQELRRRVEQLEAKRRNDEFARQLVGFMAATVAIVWVFRRR